MLLFIMLLFIMLLFIMLLFIILLHMTWTPAFIKQVQSCGISHIMAGEDIIIEFWLFIVFMGIPDDIIIEFWLLFIAIMGGSIIMQFSAVMTIMSMLSMFMSNVQPNCCMQFIPLFIMGCWEAPFIT